MIDQWNDNGGGYFNGNEGDAPAEPNKTPPRQPFLCPVTVKQVLDAHGEGVKLGSRTAVMVEMVGIVTSVERSSTNIKFNLSDDTGILNCVEWIESDEETGHKAVLNLKENIYYHVFGCIKTSQGHNRVMVFKRTPVKEFNEVTAFVLEVLNANKYTEKERKIPEQISTIKNEYNTYNPFGSVYDNQTAFTPVQRRVLDAIKSVGTQVGWSKYDPEVRKVFSAKQIQDALDFLVGEGHIYTTVDDDHFCST